MNTVGTVFVLGAGQNADDDIKIVQFHSMRLIFPEGRSNYLHKAGMGETAATDHHWFQQLKFSESISFDTDVAWLLPDFSIS